MIRRTELIRLAHGNPELQPRLLQAVEANMEFKTAGDLMSWVGTPKSAKTYAKKSLRGGDYGGAESSKQLVADMISNMQWASTPADQAHAADQVRTALAAKSITKAMADKVTAAIGSKAKKGKEAAADYFLYVEDEAGNMVSFEGPMAKSKANSKQKKDRKINEIIEAGGNASMVPASQIVEDLGSSSSAYFSKLPKSDKAKLDKALGKAGGKVASCGQVEIESEVEMGDVGEIEIEIGEINLNMGHSDNDAPKDEWSAHLDEFENSDANMMLNSGPDLVQSYMLPEERETDPRFESVRGLTAGEPGSPCPTHPIAGLRVSFAGTMEAMLSYPDAPPPGTKGTIIEARTSGRKATSHEGMVFVKFDGHKEMAVVANHLVVSEQAKKKAKRKQASMTRRASSIDALLGGGDFVKLAEDTLVHKATKDLWGLRQDVNGYVIERLFNDDGSPLKLG